MAFLAPFLILFYGFGLVGSFSLGKFLAVGLCGLWLSLGSWGWKDSRAQLAYLVAVLASALVSVDPWLSVWGLQGTYTTGVLCALGLVPFWVCFDSKDRADLENWSRVGTFLCCVVGLLQLLGWFCPSPLPGGHRVYATMGSPVYLGALIALAFPLMQSKLEMGMAFLCLLATGSRGAVLAVGGGVLYSLWDRLSEWKRKGLIVLSVVAGAALLLLRPASDSGRLLVWGAAVKAFSQRPWLGWGTGCFLVISQVFHTPEWDKVYGTVANTQDQAHNLFLEAASTGGVLTFLALSWMLWEFWKVSDKQTRACLVGVGIVGMLNPLPLVVKALAISLVATNLESKPAKRWILEGARGLQVILLLCLSFIVHWDIMMGAHGQYPWSLSSVKSAILSNAMRVGPVPGR